MYINRVNLHQTIYIMHINISCHCMFHSNMSFWGLCINFQTCRIKCYTLHASVLMLKNNMDFCLSDTPNSRTYSSRPSPQSMYFGNPFFFFPFHLISLFSCSIVHIFFYFCKSWLTSLVPIFVPFAWLSNLAGLLKPLNKNLLPKCLTLT